MFLVKYETNPTYLEKKRKKSCKIKATKIFLLRCHLNIFFFGNYYFKISLNQNWVFLLVSIHLTLRCIWSSKLSCPFNYIYLCACFVVLHLFCIQEWHASLIHWHWRHSNGQRALACFCQFLFTFSFLASQLPCPWPPSFALGYNIIIKSL